MPVPSTCVGVLPRVFFAFNDAGALYNMYVLLRAFKQRVFPALFDAGEMGEVAGSDPSTREECNKRNNQTHQSSPNEKRASTRNTAHALQRVWVCFRLGLCRVR